MQKFSYDFPTIFAKSTGEGKAAVSIYRLSGSNCQDILKKLIGKIPKANYLSLETIKDNKNEIIDKTLVSFFKGPKSFNGEDVAEFHLHASPIIEEKFIKTMLYFNVQRAKEGEFTLRAFLNGKLNLLQIENLANIYNAKNDAQLKHSFFIYRKYDFAFLQEIFDELTNIIAVLFAKIDFADEEDVSLYDDNIYNNIKELKNKFIAISDNIKNVSQSFAVTKIALLGSANSGKSTLANRILRQDRVLTSAIKGTTRDVIDLRVNIKDDEVILYDMAGLEGEEDGDDDHQILDQMGQSQSKEYAKISNIRLLFFDIIEYEGKYSWQLPNQEIISYLKEGDIIILNKEDQCTEFVESENVSINGTKIKINNIDYDYVKISAKEGNNIDELLHLLSMKVKKIKSQANNEYYDHLFIDHNFSQSIEILENAMQNYKNNIEITIEYLQNLLNNFSLLLNPPNEEEILDKIFSNFCIGK